MAVHSKEEIPNLDDQVFGTSFLPHPLPKYKFPKPETPPNAAYQLVHDELLLDRNSRQNLATFCQTWLEPEIQKLMDECLGKNGLSKPGSKERGFSDVAQSSSFALAVPPSSPIMSLTLTGLVIPATFAPCPSACSLKFAPPNGWITISRLVELATPSNLYLPWESVLKEPTGTTNEKVPI